RRGRDHRRPHLPPRPRVRAAGRQALVAGRGGGARIVSMQVTIALSKGRILDEALPLMAAAGFSLAEDPEVSRKLIIPTSRADVRVIIVRATDVPTYVQHGAA